MDEARPRAEVVVQRGDEEVASWALACPARPDLGVVDELARVALAARRVGCTVWLRQACPELLQLLELAGLRGVVLEAVGEPEDGEEVGVEEVVMPDDPVA